MPEPEKKAEPAPKEPSAKEEEPRYVEPFKTNSRTLLIINAAFDWLFGFSLIVSDPQSTERISSSGPCKSRLKSHSLR